METTHAEYSVGQIIHHKLFGYRGVIVDVDPHYRGEPDVYGKSDSHLPPKDKPWYHILVDNEEVETYVCEVNLEEGNDELPVDHPLLDAYFEFAEFREGKFQPKFALN